MSQIKSHVMQLEENGEEPFIQNDHYEEPNELDEGVWFKSQFGGWYRDKDSAGFVTAIRLHGKTFKHDAEIDAAFSEWWKSLDADMQKHEKPF